MRVIMTCGGTGGHIYPAVAIADEFRRRDPDTEILFIGSEIGMEKDLIPQTGYEITLISADGFSRTLRGMILSVRRLLKGRKQAKKLIREYRPDIVVGTGGYASAPVVYMAEKAKVPTYIHEQNAIPGKTNKLLASSARKIFLGFRKAGEYFRDPEKHIFTGNPVRREFMELSREEARKRLGIAEDEFTVLAFGGSQGAGRLNREMIKVIHEFSGQKGIRVLLGCGGYYYDAIMEEFREEGFTPADNIVIMEYIQDMAAFLKASDLVISRSGALTVAEVAVSGVPAVFVPFPQAAENHQFYNAQAVAEAGGAEVIEEKDLADDIILRRIRHYMENPGQLKEMAEKCRSCGASDAAEKICGIILEDCRK